MEQIFGAVDSSFKYILLGFNFLTLIVVYIHKRMRKVKRQHHLLFVTAHPDDEVMFFGPTIASLANDYFVHLLCLSGAGTPRENQLKLSAQNLALHRYQCISHPKLEDGLKEKWCEDTIRQLVSKYIQQNNIKAIFTFDAHGVSGHPNHQAIYRSLSACETLQEINTPASSSQSAQLKQQAQPKEETKAQIEQPAQQKDENKPQKAEEQKQAAAQAKILKIYYLQSTNLVRKYTGCLQILLALLRQFSWVRLNYISAWQAMRFHASQFTWYRKLWVLLSRYSYVNTFELRRVRVQ